VNTATKQRAQIRALLAHPRCTDEIRDSVRHARAELDARRQLTPRWEARLARYADALQLADEREARGETPFVDLPRERKAPRPEARRPRTVEDRAAHVAEVEAPAWMRDPSLLPKRPPGRP